MDRKLSSLLLAAIAVAFPASSQVGAHEKHSFYVRARGDLRIAGRLMRVQDELEGMQNLRAAETSILEAIRLIDTASVIDRKDMDDNPQIPQFLDRRSRHLAIFRLLASAKRDLGRKDSLSGRGWLNATIDQIDQAMNWVGLVVQNDFRRVDALLRYQNLISPTFGGIYVGPPF